MNTVLFMVSVPLMVLSLRFDQKAQANRDDLDNMFPVVSWLFLLASVICMYYAADGKLLNITAMLVANVGATVLTMLVIIPRLFKEKS